MEIINEEFKKLYTEHTGFDFKLRVDEHKGKSLLNLYPRQNFVLCLSIVETTYDFLDKAIMYEDDKVVNYIIGVNAKDKEFKIGDIAHFGSRIPPNNFTVKGNKGDKDLILKSIKDNNVKILSEMFIKSQNKPVNKEALKKSFEDGTSIAGTDKLILAKFLLFNSSFLTSFSEYEHFSTLAVHSELSKRF